MRRILFWFALTPLLVTTLLADWKIVTIYDGHTATEYYKGPSLRTDVSRVYTTVADFDHRKQITWRTDLRQYTVLDWPPLPPPADPSSRPVIKIESTTTDTGERKKFFGRTARHLITRTMRDGLETQTDGWYIDAPGLPRWKRGGTAIAVLTSSVGNQKPLTPRIDFKQTGPAPEGLAVLLKTSSQIAMPGAPAHTFENSSQVIELDEGPLPDRLFQPPDGYHRVDQLSTAGIPAPRSWAESAQYEWRRMQAWINSLFNRR
jgi:hypothetical protein